MKISKIAPLFWIANLLLLGGGLALAWNAMQDTKQDRADSMAKVDNLRTDLPRIEWKAQDNDPAPADLRNVVLSPIERPMPPAPELPPVEVEKPKPKTDDELRRELEAELRRRFKVIRMVLCSGDTYTDSAMLVAGRAKLHWFEGTNLKQKYQAAQSYELREFALDINVIEVDEEGVLLDAPSFEVPEKRFEIRLPVTDTDPSNARFFSTGGAFRPGDKLDPDREENWGKPHGPDGTTEPANPNPSPRPDEKTFDPGEFSDEEIEAIMKQVRATEHGVQVLPDIPEDSPLRRYGARGGEIIKSINGVAVKSAADIRKTVRQQHDNGTREFEIVYERDGVPGRRTITAQEE